MLARLQKYLPHLYLFFLLTWGVYVTFTWIGVDGHIVVLLKSGDWQNIASETSSAFWRGVQGLVPMVQYLLERLRPFLGYGVVCVLLYGGYVLYSIFVKGRLFLELRLSAVHVLLFGLVSLWILSTMLFYAPLGSIQPRLIIEPKQEVYDNVGAEGLAVLQENFERLKDMRCLQEITDRKGKAGAAVFQYKGICMQKFFVTRVLPPLAILLFLILDFLVLGSAALRLLKVTCSSKLKGFLFSLSLGTASMIFLLWWLAFFSLLSAPYVWGLLIAIPLIGYRFTLSWLRDAWRERWRVQSSFYGASIFLFWLLISYIAFNYLTVVRPFPIGWDDLGRYINMPRQLSAFSHIVPNIPAISWEYLTSLGFVLFGYFSTLGATLAQQINWMAGLFAVLAVYGGTRILIGPGSGLLAALFYYTLPMVGHFAFADMKTENALLFFGVMGLLAVCEYCKLWKVREAEGDSDATASSNSPPLSLLFVAGLLLAAGFATKVTIILMVLLTGIVLAGMMLGWTSAFGATLLSLAVLAKAGSLNVANIATKVAGGSWSSLNTIAFVFCVLVGIALIATPVLRPYLQKKSVQNAYRLRSFVIALLIMACGFAAYTVPWMGRNMIEHGNMKVLTALKAPNVITPWIRISSEPLPVEAPEGSRSLPKELAVDQSHEMCKSTATTEELDRYWGHGSGPMHYLGLPWRTVMNIDSQGYYLTTSALLLLLPLVVLIPFFWRRENRLLHFVSFGTLFYALEWIVVANGIPWYGIGMFFGFAVLVELIVTKAPDKFSRGIISALACVALVTAFSLRMWQFGMQMNLYEYAWGKASAQVLEEMTIPDYDDITDHVLELSKNLEQPYLYRMGTFISYFIPRNLEIITVNDNQLTTFNCLNQEQDHQLTLKRLQALGFHSIVFDTNTATIEKDPNGTLHQKVQRFIDFANDPTLNIQAVVNNPGGGVAYMILPKATVSVEKDD